MARPVNVDLKKRLVDLVMRGLHIKEMAQELGLAPATVKYHLHKIYVMHGVQDSRQLMSKIYLALLESKK